MPGSDGTASTLLVADLGGTHLRLGHLHGGRPALASERHRTDTLRVADPVGALAGLLGAYMQTHHLEPEAVVVGVPVSLGADLDTVLSSPNLPQMEGVAVGTALSAALGLPVRLERDVILHLLGEARAGAARGAADVLAVYFGTGVGAAYLQGGQPHRGHPVSLELGHIPVRADGRRCVCGNLDCLEAYACGHVLRELAERSGVPVAELFARRAEPPGLDRALHDFVRDQARAVATAINLLGPQVAVIGGGIPAMAGYPGEALLDLIRSHLRRPEPRAGVRLAWAELGWQAALHGAPAVVARYRCG